MPGAVREFQRVFMNRDRIGGILRFFRSKKRQSLRLRKHATRTYTSRLHGTCFQTECYEIFELSFGSRSVGNQLERNEQEATGVAHRWDIHTRLLYMMNEYLRDNLLYQRQTVHISDEHFLHELKRFSEIVRKSTSFLKTFHVYFEIF